MTDEFFKLAVKQNYKELQYVKQELDFEKKIVFNLVKKNLLNFFY
jgi:hypothetical protein